MFNGTGKIIIDICGLTMTTTAIILNWIAGWLTDYNINQIVTVVLSIISGIYLVVKTYNTWKNGILNRKEQKIRIKEAQKQFDKE